MDIPLRNLYCLCGINCLHSFRKNRTVHAREEQNVTQKNPEDLLTPIQASEAVFEGVTPKVIRRQVRIGELKRYRRPKNFTPEASQQKRGRGRPDGSAVLFVKRKELMKLYEDQLYIWEQTYKTRMRLKQQIKAAKKNAHK